MQMANGSENGKGTEIRRLVTPGEVEDSLRLAQYAFQFELSEKELEEERNKTVPDWIWGAFADGRLVAQVIQYPLEVYVQGKAMKMGGIGAVASWPESRRGGLIAQLLGRVIRAMKDDGQVISLLTPFSYAFYRKYGWEMAIDRKKYTVPAYLWPVKAKDPVSGTIERWNMEDSRIVAELGPVYEQFASRYNGTLSRSPEWWNHRVIRNRRGDYAVCRDDAGTIRGYMQYRMKNREFTIQEFVALDREAERALWRFIAMHDSMAERAVLYVPVDDGLSLTGAEPRFGQEIEPYFMARIVDIEAFVRQYAFNPLEERIGKWVRTGTAILTLEVSDDHAPWNNGRFRIAVDEAGRADAGKLEEGAPAEGPIIRGSIQAFAALFTGYRSATELLRIGMLSGSDEAVRLLQTLIPAKTPFLCDFF